MIMPDEDIAEGHWERSAAPRCRLPRDRERWRPAEALDLIAMHKQSPVLADDDVLIPVAVIVPRQALLVRQLLTRKPERDVVEV